MQAPNSCSVLITRGSLLLAFGTVWILMCPYWREIDAILDRDDLAWKKPTTVAASRGGYNSYRSELSVFHDL